jgi:probable rRNA maturation factor
LSIHVHNRQRSVPIRLPWLRRFACVALESCLDCSADGRFALRNLEDIEVAIVSDRVIAGVHERFMNIPGATDVITFEHGEIVMSAQTAAVQARPYGHGVDVELALYIVHGLLHLNGYEDAAPRDAARMRRTQQRILRACLAQTPTV